MNHWAFDAFFYHIYPLGLCGAPFRNDFSSTTQPRLEQLYSWMDHMSMIGVNAVYLGPLFESSSHGYDTVDYYRVDRRLGDNHTLKSIVAEFHRRGMRVILDGVFNHVSRDFWAFKDVLNYGEHSIYRDWFHLRFGEQSAFGDPFSYAGWNGYYELVKLNLNNANVKDHLFSAVKSWINDYDIDGLRLDAADCLDMSFNQELGSLCRTLRPDFFLVGEIIHGDYRKWVNQKMFDSVTNYECYKGLYSSHNDKNYFEIAWSFNRQFGDNGLYRDLPLYNFADNHDVNRVASQIKNPAYLYPLYCLLFTMPGVPSIYYGSEWGIEGEKKNGSDQPLRPQLNIGEAPWQSSNGDLLNVITRLAHLRHDLPVLRSGTYRQHYVAHQQLVFSRVNHQDVALVMVNAAAQPVSIQFDATSIGDIHLVDILNQGKEYEIKDGKWHGDIDSNWARILVPARK